MAPGTGTSWKDRGTPFSVTEKSNVAGGGLSSSNRLKVAMNPWKPAGGSGWGSTNSPWELPLMVKLATKTFPEASAQEKVGKTGSGGS